MLVFLVSERVLFNAIQQFVSYIMARTS